MRLIGFAGNGVEAMAEFRRFQPDVTLMDLQLPGSNGTDVLVAIRGEFPRARIVMLTTSDGDGEIQRAMRAGAAAYLLKSMDKDDLLAVIRSVHSGRRHVPAEVAARLAEHLGEDDLTARELEVLTLIRDGYRNKQIADQLAIAETTVNFHIKTRGKGQNACSDDCAAPRPAPNVAIAPVDSYRMGTLSLYGARLAWRNYCLAAVNRWDSLCPKI
jgi:DNA-binding NarL/FixJ family response regulator